MKFNLWIAMAVIASQGMAQTPIHAQGASPSSAPQSKVDSDETDPSKLTAKEANLPPRKSNWSVGVDLRQLNVSPEDRRYKQKELSPDINIGFVWIEESFWAKGGLHLPLGPTSQRYPDSPPLDNEGYGVSATFGKTLSAGSLRQSSGDYGIELGLESFELSARSFRRQVLDDGSTTDAWTVKTRWLGITPAIFATFLRPARPQGNNPEWLMTRIEGYRVAFGIVIPVQRSWDLRYKQGEVTKGDRGSWKGVHGLASLNTWLGI